MLEARVAVVRSCICLKHPVKAGKDDRNSWTKWGCSSIGAARTKSGRLGNPISVLLKQYIHGHLQLRRRCVCDLKVFQSCAYWVRAMRIPSIISWRIAGLPRRLHFAIVIDPPYPRELLVKRRTRRRVHVTQLKAQVEPVGSFLKL
jgi:hypothetical protein